MSLIAGSIKVFDSILLTMQLFVARKFLELTRLQPHVVRQVDELKRMVFHLQGVNARKTNCTGGSV